MIRFIFIVLFMSILFALRSFGIQHLAFQSISGNEVKSDSPPIWMKIVAPTQEVRSQIANTGASIEQIRDGYVYATGSARDREKILKFAKIEVEFQLSTQMLDFPIEDQVYHNYSEMTSELKELAKNNSKIAKLFSIGKSHEGREIWAFRINGGISDDNIGDSKPAIIYMGGHHAREHLSIEIPLMLIQHILSQYNQNVPEFVHLVQSRDLHFVPMLNPDGAEWDIHNNSYNWWRKNRRPNGNGIFGVDLNRNYGFQWGTGGSSPDTDSETYMGPEPFSEPETQAIRNYVHKQQNITMLLSFHTFSQLILYPWSFKNQGVENQKDLAVYQRLANQMAEWNHYTPMQSSLLYIASGDTADWAYGEEKIFSFTFELDPGEWSVFSGGFYPGSSIIHDVFNKNLKPSLLLAEYSDNPYRILDEPSASAAPATNFSNFANFTSFAKLLNFMNLTSPTRSSLGYGGRSLALHWWESLEL